MAASLAAAAQAQHFAVDDVRAMQHHQPMHRTREAVVVIAPAHRLGDRQAPSSPREDLRQQRGGRRARLDAARYKPGALVGLKLFQRVQSTPSLRETLQRLASAGLRHPARCATPGRAARSAARAAPRPRRARTRPGGAAWQSLAPGRVRQRCRAWPGHRRCREEKAWIGQPAP